MSGARERMECVGRPADRGGDAEGGEGREEGDGCVCGQIDPVGEWRVGASEHLGGLRSACGERSGELEERKVSEDDDASAMFALGGHEGAEEEDTHVRMLVHSAYTSCSLLRRDRHTPFFFVFSSCSFALTFFSSSSSVLDIGAVLGGVMLCAAVVRGVCTVQ